MKTLDIEIALLEDCKFNQNIVVPNVANGIVRHFGEKPNRTYDELHECDILKVTLSGYATEYEIKISKSDFKADFKKKHNHDSKFIKQLYYVVPFELLEFAKENLPNNAGLAYAKNDKIYYITNAPMRENAFKWTNEEMFKLARLGAMRIYNLKQNIAKMRNVV